MIYTPSTRSNYQQSTWPRQSTSNKPWRSPKRRCWSMILLTLHHSPTSSPSGAPSTTLFIRRTLQQPLRRSEPVSRSRVPLRERRARAVKPSRDLITSCCLAQSGTCPNLSAKSPGSRARSPQMSSSVPLAWQVGRVRILWKYQPGRASTLVSYSRSWQARS